MSYPPEILLALEEDFFQASNGKIRYKPCYFFLKDAMNIVLYHCSHYSCSFDSLQIIS